MMNEEKREQRDKEELENLKLGYAALNEDYRIQTERLKTADEKNNMLLVFNAAILALLTIVFPLNESARELFVLSIILFTLFMVSIIITVTMIIVAIYPRKTQHLSHKSFVNADFYHRTTIEFMGQIMRQQSESIKSMHETAEKKFMYAKIAIITTFINIALISMLIIVCLL